MASRAMFEWSPKLIRDINKGAPRAMTKPSREDLERLVTADMRAITAQSDRIGRVVARKHGVTNNDFQALLQVFVAETTGSPLTSRQLSERMEVSGSAITYFVERMAASGHIRRESHPADRRKVILRYGDHGIQLARAFFHPARGPRAHGDGPTARWRSRGGAPGVLRADERDADFKGRGRRKGERRAPDQRWLLNAGVTSS
jgi:DNA-binding MarR family transcriptional regulator